MPDDELLEVVDEQDNVLEVVPRTLTEDRNDIVRNVIIFIFNNKGEVLVQLRAQTKKHYPGLYDPSACGAVMAGHSDEDSAARELFEETGIKTPLKYAGKFLNRFPDETGMLTRSRFSRIYIGTYSGSVKPNEEVERLEWVQADELKKRCTDHPELFVPSYAVELEWALKARNKL